MRGASRRVRNAPHGSLDRTAMRMLSVDQDNGAVLQPPAKLSSMGGTHPPSALSFGLRMERCGMVIGELRPPPQLTR